MIELKKGDLVNVLLTIVAYNKEEKMVGGLLMEKVSLGLKRRLQKIHSEIMPHYNQFQKDLTEAEKKDTESGLEGSNKEVSELLGEPIKLMAEKVSLAMLDALESENVYDDKLIEKIAE